MGKGWSIAAVAAMLMTANCGSDGPAEPTAVPSTPPPAIIAPPTLDDTTLLTVLGVLDARTVLLSDGSQIIIDGLAPAEECWAAAATAFSKAFLQDKPVRIERAYDPTKAETPLWLQDGTEYALFAVGQGVLRSDAPHDPAYGAAEATATRTGLGLWGAPCLGKATAPAPPASSATPIPPRTTTAPATTYGCTVTYRVARRWQGGFHAEVSIANTGNTDVLHWALRWSFARGETATNTWNTTIEQSGAQVKATDVPASATIPAGGTQWLRFNATQGWDSPAPKTFTLNDRPCDVKSL